MSASEQLFRTKCAMVGFEITIVKSRGAIYVGKPGVTLNAYAGNTANWALSLYLLNEIFKYPSYESREQG